jgi:hypothetical protein
MNSPPTNRRIIRFLCVRQVSLVYSRSPKKSVLSKRANGVGPGLSEVPLLQKTPIIPIATEARGRPGPIGTAFGGMKRRRRINRTMTRRTVAAIAFAANMMPVR